MLASLVIANALRVPEIASLIRAHPQSWQSAQKPAESVWQSAKNTQLRIQRAKHVQKPVGSVSNTVKAQRNSPIESTILRTQGNFFIDPMEKRLICNPSCVGHQLGDDGKEGHYGGYVPSRSCF